MSHSGRAQIEEVLWNAGEALRGLLPRAEQTRLLLALLFLKRIADTEVGSGGAAGSGAAACWSDALPLADNVAETLERAFRLLEHAYPWLEGALQGFAFQHVPAPTLRTMVKIYSRVTLSPEQIDDILLGEVCERLLERTAARGGDGTMEYYTPSTVAELMVSVAGIGPQMTVHDPACGWGQLLVKAAGHALKWNRGGLELSGQEINFELWATGKLNVALHGVSARIARGDTLSDPRFVADGHLEQFDRVLCDPPFGLWKTGVEVARRDYYNRYTFGAPPRSSTDFAFIQHAYAALKPGGKAVVLVPQGALFRSGREQVIREKLLQHGVIDTVIWLPSTFTRTQLATAIVVLSKHEPAVQQSSVLLIDASRAGPLNTDLIRRITKAVDSPSFDTEFGREVSWTEISEHDFNLNVPLYMWGSPEALTPDLRDYYARAAALSSRQQQLASDVDSLIEIVAQRIQPER